MVSFLSPCSLWQHAVSIFFSWNLAFSGVLVPPEIYCPTPVQSCICSCCYLWQWWTVCWAQAFQQSTYFHWDPGTMWDLTARTLPWCLKCTYQSTLFWDCFLSPAVSERQAKWMWVWKHCLPPCSEERAPQDFTKTLQVRAHLKQRPSSACLGQVYLLAWLTFSFPHFSPGLTGRKRSQQSMRTWGKRRRRCGNNAPQRRSWKAH